MIHFICSYVSYVFQNGEGNSFLLTDENELPEVDQDRVITFQQQQQLQQQPHHRELMVQQQHQPQHQQQQQQNKGRQYRSASDALLTIDSKEEKEFKRKSVKNEDIIER